MISAKLPVYD